MTKYLIQLTPCGKYFFGGETMFPANREPNKINDKEKQEEKFSSYLIESYKVPQQTSLLGMLRFLVLSNNESAFDRKENHIKEDKKEVADALIGVKSFTVNEDGHENDFGKIKNIGPCLIYHKTNKVPYFSIPAAAQLKSVDSSASQKAYLNGKEVLIPTLTTSEGEQFTCKNGFEAIYRPLKEEKILNESELFIEDGRLGIAISENGRVEDQAFYKQVSYRLHPDFCFAFEAEVDVDLTDSPYQHSLVKLGGDDSVFIFEAEETEAIVYPSESSDHKVTLLSEAFLPRTMEEVSFAISETRSTRFLQTENVTNANNYNTRFKSLRSARYELYLGGSTFYFKNEVDKQKFIDRLEKHKEFSQIGYNKYY